MKALFLNTLKSCGLGLALKFWGHLQRLEESRWSVCLLFFPLFQLILFRHMPFELRLHSLREQLVDLLFHTVVEHWHKWCICWTWQKGQLLFNFLVDFRHSCHCRSFPVCWTEKLQRNQDSGTFLGPISHWRWRSVVSSSQFFDTLQLYRFFVLNSVRNVVMPQKKILLDSIFPSHSNTYWHCWCASWLMPPNRIVLLIQRWLPVLPNTSRVRILPSIAC